MTTTNRFIAMTILLCVPMLGGARGCEPDVEIGKNDGGTLPTQDGGPPQCGPVCAIFCPNGNVLDANGCPTCECNPATTCGGFGGAQCGAGEYCHYALGDQCGAADQTGTCRRIGGRGCTEQYAPVCGCDGRTYSNECFANAAGTSAARTGTCAPEPVDAGPAPVFCGGFAGQQCGAGQFCNYPLEAQCGIADGSGTCAPIPDACAELNRPVCGCDGRRYGNECLANAAGVSVQALDACR